MELLQSPLRVMNASEADLVYVPFYVVNLANTHSRDSCGRPLSHEEAEAVVRDFWAEAPALLPLLGRVPHWMVGRPLSPASGQPAHGLTGLTAAALAESGCKSMPEQAQAPCWQRLSSGGAAAPQMLAQLQLETMDGCADVDLRGWGVSFTCHPGFAHLTVGVPEPFSGRSEAARHDRLLSAVPHFPNTLAVPYLGHVHHGPRDYAAAFDPGGLAAGKAARAAMVFTATRKTQLRPALLRQCAAHPGQCTAPEFPRDRVGDALAGMVEAYAHAWHCVQPWGDTPTRLAFYECAATGAALPVVFDPRLPDFLAFADLVDYRAFVTVLDPQAFISGEQDIVQVLSAPSPQDMLARLERLHRVRHVMQYAVRPQHLLVRFDERETVHAGDDAFTASFKAALRNLCRRGLLPDKCLQTGAA